MKYATPPSNFGNSTVKWKEITTWKHGEKAPVTTVKLAKQILEREEFWIYDSDNSGDDEFYISIVDDENKYHYYKINHSWYWHGEWGDDGHYLENEFKWTEVTKEEAKIPDDRDYLDTFPKSSIPVNWPPKS